MPKTRVAAVVSPTRRTCAKGDKGETIGEQLPDVRQLGAAVRDLVDPTGRCIHEFATMMKNADSQLPSANSHTVAEVEARTELVPAEDPAGRGRSTQA